MSGIELTRLPDAIFTPLDDIVHDMSLDIVARRASEGRGGKSIHCKNEGVVVTPKWGVKCLCELDTPF